MPTNLTNTKVSDTYFQLLHVDGGVTGEEKTVHDGDGTPTAFKVGTQSASVDNIQIDGNTIRSTNPNGDIHIEPDGTGITRLKRLNVTGGIVADTFSITGGGSFLGIEGIASIAEAQAGTNNSKVITPLRLREGLNAPGSAPVYACRAWVNFNGVTGTIRAVGNVSSITHNATGIYTVNFTNAMPDANYAVSGVARDTLTDTGSNSPNVGLTNGVGVTMSATAFSIDVVHANGQFFVNSEVVTIAVFR